MYTPVRKTCEADGVIENDMEETLEKAFRNFHEVMLKLETCFYN